MQCWPPCPSNHIYEEHRTIEQKMEQRTHKMAAEDEYNNTQQEMNAVTIVFIKLK
jgi:hypothetical protein